MAFSWGTSVPATPPTTKPLSKPDKPLSKDSFVSGKTEETSAEKYKREKKEREDAIAAARGPGPLEQIKALSDEAEALRLKVKALVEAGDETVEEMEGVLARSQELYDCVLVAYGALQAVKHENGIQQIVARVTAALEGGRPQ